jgi:RHS repeat-associated protein
MARAAIGRLDEDAPHVRHRFSPLRQATAGHLYSSSRVLNSGFSLTVSGLTPGTYQVQARAHSAYFGVWTTFTQTFYVTNTPPRIVIEAPTSNGVVSAPFAVSGWAVDPEAASGTGMDTVQVFTCPVACTGSNGTFRGMATYGLARPDVATLTGNSRFTNSGFSFTFSTLPVGQYEVQLQVRSTFSARWNVVWVRFMVAVSNPHMGLDTLPTSVAQPFAVTGWGLDAGVPSGTGVDHVQIWVYPNPGSGTPPVFWGTATLGQSRPDVAAVYGSQFANSGYQFTVSGKPPGAYLLVANVYYLSGTVQSQNRTIYVDTPTVPVTIDRQGMGTGAVSASGLTCPGGAGTQGLPCGAAYPFNTVVTLTAVPDTGSAFGGWSGACSGSGACQVTLDQARFVAALFTKTADTPTTSYYHVDAQGSVRAISDDSGAIVIRHDYYTFGEDAQPLTGDPLRYAGKELDPETAQEYFGARYYRNVWGRFGTVDPIYSSAAVTDPQQWNRYAYARNNPLKFSDPLGADINCTTTESNQHATCSDIITVNGDTFNGTIYIGGCVFGYRDSDLYFSQCRPGASIQDPFGGEHYDDDGGGSGGALVYPDRNTAPPIPVPPPVAVPTPSAPATPSATPPIEPLQCGAFCQVAKDVVQRTEPLTRPSTYAWLAAAPFLGGAIITAPETGLAQTAINAIGTYGEYLFAKGSQVTSKGILNDNPVIRIGYGWKGSKAAGSLVFRVALCSPGSWCHTHFDLWTVYSEP